MDLVLNGRGDCRKGGNCLFVDKAPSAAFLASLSARSLPRALLCAAIHLNLIFSRVLVGGCLLYE